MNDLLDKIEKIREVKALLPKGVEVSQQIDQGAMMMQQVSQQIMALQNQIQQMAMPMMDNGTREIMPALSVINNKIDQLIEEITTQREKVVEFEVVTDRFNFPTKVIAREQ